MSVEMAPATVDHLEHISDICYRAFKDISERHGFPTDFEDEPFARMVLGGLIRNETCHSTVALADGRVAGSNFITTADDVGTIGPISVDPDLQGSGIGRALMEESLAFARENGIERVRLMQDSFNMMSLALYSSLGFDTKAPVTLLEPAARSDEHVRPATRGDLDAIEHLSRAIYRVSRRNEVAHHLSGPFVPYVREQAGRITGYFIIGMVGHGVAETEEDMIALILHAAGHVPAPLARAFCPLTEGSLYRRLLTAGCRNRKVMNLMARGPYEEPQGVWVPSVGF
jgi:predicted N-acetyltransferase YhbS